MNKESSDEKLLKLIERSGYIPPLASVGVKRRNTKLGMPFPVIKLKFHFNLFSLNRALFVLGALLTGVFLYNFIAGSRYSNSDFLIASVKNLSAFSKPKITEDKATLDLQEYLNSLDRRNAFLAAGFSKKENIDNALVSALVKDLKLVGIIWSSNPEAMIEDSVEKRTSLFKKGDKFSQDRFVIKNITRNSVILELNIGNQVKEYELR